MSTILSQEKLVYDRILTSSASKCLSRTFYLAITRAMNDRASSDELGGDTKFCVKVTMSNSFYVTRSGNN